MYGLKLGRTMKAMRRTWWQPELHQSLLLAARRLAGDAVLGLEGHVTCGAIGKIQAGAENFQRLVVRWHTPARTWSRHIPSLNT